MESDNLNSSILLIFFRNDEKRLSSKVVHLERYVDGNS